MPGVQSNAPPGVPPLTMPPGIDELPGFSDEPAAIVKRLKNHEPDNAAEFDALLADIADESEIARTGSDPAERERARIKIKVYSEWLRRHEREHRERAIEAIRIGFKRVAAEHAAKLRALQAVLERVTTAARTSQPRPRAARRHHSTPRITVAAASAGESSPHSAEGSPRRGTSARAQSDLAPAGRIRHRDEWIVARVSTRTAGSPASFSGVTS